MGTKGRPFYRIVVAKSTAARNGSFVEVLGTYDPLTKPSTVKLDGEKALKWLLTGAQPTETTAHILQREGVLEKFFEQRPAARKKFKSLNKVTAAMSRKSVVEVAEKAQPVVEENATEATVAEAPAETVEAVAEEAPPVEATPEPEATAEVADAPVDEATPTEETNS